jgi:indolepyruvate decarboxylase
MMVGVEIRRLGIETLVAELSRRLGFPVVTSFMGRGLLATADVPLNGTYMGMAGDSQLSDLVENADALVLLGVILSDTNLGTSRRKLDLKRCILAQWDSVSLGYHVYPDIPLPCLVDALLKKWPPGRGLRPPAAWTGRPAAGLRGLAADQQPMAPDDIARGINDLIAGPSESLSRAAQPGPRHQELDRCPPAGDALEPPSPVVKSGAWQLVADVGDALFIAMDIDEAELAAPGYYASMGYAVPAGLGIQAATGKRPLVLVGDGAFQMTGWELGNAARYGWDPMVVVLNNCGWEMLRAFTPQSRFNDLATWRFAELARALGGDGREVRTRAEWRDALAAAVSTRGRFQLIEVHLPRGLTSRNMTRYVEGLTGKR